ncbi:cell wall-binding repeat-containing protein [Leifsonia sp. NPDC077715]|uniref:cell wall-binding repeat-containing protein n=1 Tax=Leifsonia sp. NPDC077715 TaxID=3155539 RepID=UPI003431B822
MRDRAASVPVVDRSGTAHPRRRSVAALTIAALAATGLAALGVAPASASPGNGVWWNAFDSTVGTLTDVAVDSYTAQAFAAVPGQVTIVDEFSGDVIGSVPLPTAGSPLLAVDARRALVWTLDAGQHKLYRIDERTNTVTGTATVAGDVRDLTVDHSTATVFVATGTDGTIVPVNEATLAVGTPITVGGTLTRVDVDASAGTLYAIDAAGPKVAVVDEASSTVSKVSLPTAPPSALTVDAAHHKAYVGFTSLSTLSVIDGPTLTAGTPVVLPTGYGAGVQALGTDPTTQTVIAFNNAQMAAVDTVTGTAATASTPVAPATAPHVAIDVFTNTVAYGSGFKIYGYWEPVSFLSSVSGVVPVGTSYLKQIEAWSWSNESLSFSVTKGALPTGLTISGDTIVGTATTPGDYTFDLTATDAEKDSVTQTYTLRVVTVNRTSGSDRFATSVEVSKASYPDPADAKTVYVANGISFPDALSGGPAAAEDSGPLLLTAPGYLPTVVSNEIKRLNPAHIVVVGGPAVVGADVFSALQKLSPDVKRVYGSDRFGTSQAVIKHSFSTAPTVYVSTGLNFPDSLSAGGAAGSLHAPLLLVNGNATSVDAATASLLQSLGTSKIVVIGGSAVMSPSLVADFARFGTVVHLAGSDRFDSSQQVVESAFSTSSRVILANGLNFPDALGASAWSGASGSPLFITLPNCVPQRTLDDTYFLGATKVTLVGGTTVLNGSVFGLQTCGGSSVIAPAYPASAPVTGKKVTAFGSGSAASGQPVAPLLRVSQGTERPTGH